MFITQLFERKKMNTQTLLKEENGGFVFPGHKVRYIAVLSVQSQIAHIQFNVSYVDKLAVAAVYCSMHYFDTTTRIRRVQSTYFVRDKTILDAFEFPQ